MLTINRQSLHLFRTLARRAGVKPLGKDQSPQIVIQSDLNGSKLVTASHDVRLEYAWSETSAERVSWPLGWDLLEECGAKQSDCVTLAPDGTKLVHAQWSQRGIPQRQNFEIFPEPKLPATLRNLTSPPNPESWTIMEASFWSALADAVPCADQDATRYALGCLHLRGKSGDLNATDGRHVLQQGGFDFPWSEDLLVVANKILGSKEISGESPLQIARTDDWLAMKLGAWTIWLRIDKTGRFPQIDSIMPNASRMPTKLVLAEADAEFLRQALTALPGRTEQHHPVTLDLNGHVAVRGQENLQTPPTELILSQSRRDGEQICVNLNREFLAQAVRLGFREIQFGSDKSPALCVDERRKYLFALLDAESAIRPTPDMLTIQSIAPQTVSSKSTQPSPSTIPMSKANRINPAPVQPKHTAPVPTNNPTPVKPIEAALALRESLRESLDKTTQLITALKQQKKHSRLMQSTLASLKQLQAVA